jgi:hypothetical protein
VELEKRPGQPLKEDTPKILKKRTGTTSFVWPDEESISKKVELKVQIETDRGRIQDALGKLYS